MIQAINSKTNIFLVEKGREGFLRLVIFWLVQIWIRLPWSAVQLNWITLTWMMSTVDQNVKRSCKSFMVEMMVTKGQKWKSREHWKVIIWLCNGSEGAGYSFDRIGGCFCNERCLYPGIPLHVSNYYFCIYQRLKTDWVSLRFRMQFGLR